MAEKNTLSILESIKQKMAKFDEKDTKSITAFDNDFDYPANSGNSADTSKTNPDISFVDNHKEENDKVNNDDFLFEHEETKRTEDKKSFLHEEDEFNLEDEIDEEFEEEDDDEHDVKPEEQTHHIDDSDEDFIIGKEDNKKLHEEENHDQGEDLDLDDEIDLDVEDEIEEVKKPQEKPVEMKVEMKKEHEEELEENDEEEDFDEDENDNEDDDDLDDLNIDLDEFDKEDSVKEPVMKAVPMHFEEKMKMSEKSEVKIEDKVKVGASTNNHDEDFEEIDLDLSDDVTEENVAKTNQPIMPAEPEAQKSAGYNQAINIQINNNSLDNSHNNISAIPSRKAPSMSRPLLNEETLQQSTNSIKKLIDANNVVQGIKNFTEQNNSALNELAVQLMESRLERWLNDHLPDLVEKIVRDEIKKIIPKE